jgi:GNAT superfamily N-acetyltransferase
MHIEIGGYCPGAIGRVAEMHAEYYHRNWGFGLFFEAKVATELAEFLCRFEKGRDGFWTLLSGDRVEGAIAIDGLKGATEGAHLRWFIVSSGLKGGGWGRRLMTEAVAFCDRHDYQRIGLWTFAGLDAARHLYEAFGFRLAFEEEGEQWGPRVIEQRFERNQGPAAPSSCSAPPKKRVRDNLDALVKSLKKS